MGTIGATKAWQGYFQKHRVDKTVTRNFMADTALFLRGMGFLDLAPHFFIDSAEEWKIASQNWCCRVLKTTPFTFLPP